MPEIVNCGAVSFQQKQSYDYHMSLTDASNPEIMILDLDVSELDMDAVGKTINRLFEEVDSLRTVFTAEGENVFQKILAFEGLEYFYFERIDQTEVTYNDAAVEQLLAVFGNRMRLSENSLLCKSLIVSFKGGIRRCLFFIHHILVDLWSMLLIKRKFYQLYHSHAIHDALLGQPLQPAYNMIDYANEQRKAYALTGGSAIAYWQNKLEPALAGDRSLFLDITGTRTVNPGIQTTGGTVQQLLNNEASGFMALKIEGKSLENVYHILKTTNAGFMALFNVIFSLLPGYRGADKRTLIASPVNNRLNSRLKSVVGLCGGSIYTYLTVDPELSIAQILNYAYLNVLKSFKYAITDHGMFKLDGLHLREKCDVFLNITSKEFENNVPENYYTGEAFEGKTSYYALECIIHEQEDHICIVWGYNKAFYSTEQVNRLSASLFELIELLSTYPDKPLSELYAFEKRAFINL